MPFSGEATSLSVRRWAAARLLGLAARLLHRRHVHDDSGCGNFV